MPKKILIIQNTAWVGAGLLIEVLKENNIPYQIFSIDQETTFPDVREYDGVVVLGGTGSANDATPKMRQELENIKDCLQFNVPYLGSCLGLQALVKAGGGQVVNSPIKEVGFRNPDGNFFGVEVTDKGETDPLLQGLEQGFETFYSHGESVELTPDMQLLGTGKFCENQIVKVGERAYGMQCHPELTPELFEVWKQENPDLQKLNQEQLNADYQTLREKYRQGGKQLFTNWLRVAGFEIE